jgi:MoaA/NifB/PqqE/SkfB family radical SAM enzyme/predicted negative regulator of RcsB-dependent stress response
MKRNRDSSSAIADFLAAGQAYFEKKKYDEARHCFEQALSGDAGNGDALIGMAKVLKAQGHYDEALEMFSNVEEETIPGRNIDKEIKELYFVIGRMKDAPDRFRSLIRQGEKDVWMALRSGYVCAADREHDRAVRMFMKAARTMRWVSEAHDELARIYQGRNDSFRAARETKRIKIRKASGVQTLKKIAGDYLKDNERIKAMRLFEAVLSLDPDDGESPAHLAAMHQESGDACLARKEFTNALAEYGRALQYRPDDSVIRRKIEDAGALRGKNTSISGKEQHPALQQDGADTTGRRCLLEFYRLMTDCAYAIAGGTWADSRDGYRKRLRGIGRRGRREGDAAVTDLVKKCEAMDAGGDLKLDDLRVMIGGHAEGDDIYLQNKVLNEIEILQGKLVLESKPTNLRVTLTNRCNLFCRMCYLHKRIAWDMPDAALEELDGFIPYLEQVIWQGGEVFLSKYFERLFAKAAGSTRLKQVVITNGLLIDERWADRFASAGHVELRLSIDGVTKQTYEAVRRGGNFSRLLGVLEMINRRKAQSHGRLETHMNFVVTKKNYHEIEKALEFAAEHEFRNAVFVPVINPAHDDGNTCYQSDPAIVREIAALYPRLQKKADEYGIGFDYRLTEHCLEPSGASEEEDAKDRAQIIAADPGPSCSCPPVQENGRQNDPVKDCGRMGRAGLPFCRVPWQSMFIGEYNDVAPECICSTVLKQDSPEFSLNRVWNGRFMQEYRSRMLDNRMEWCNRQCVSGLFPPQNREMGRL